MEPIFIKDFLPKQIFNFVQSYCLIKYSNLKHFKGSIDTQSSSLVAEYSDFVMETLMDLSTPVIQQNTKKNLYPTYTYFRIYDKLSDLPVHDDRPACEYTVALCLGSDPTEKPYDIFIGEEDITSDYKYVNGEGKSIPLKIEHKFSMLPNTALIFQGMDKLHWREKCQHDYFMTVFLHYVDQDGKYKDQKYDKRLMLGETKD